MVSTAMVSNKDRPHLRGKFSILVIVIIVPVALLFLTPAWDDHLSQNFPPYFTEHDPNSTARSILSRLQRRLLQYTIIRELHDREKTPIPQTALEEIKGLENTLLTFRTYVRTQSEIPHRMLAGPAIVTGLGWCNQINEDAAIWLAQEFGACEVVAVYDLETKVGHTIGRVKSRFDGQWIYFDAWPSRPCLFKITQHGTLDYLTSRTEPTTPERDMDFQRLDALAAQSPITGTFPRNYVGYLAARLTRNEDTRVAEAGTIKAEKLFPPADRNQLRIYVEARVAHLKGFQSKAKSLYEASSNYSKSTSKSVLGAAAESFSRPAMHKEYDTPTQPID